MSRSFFYAVLGVALFSGPSSADESVAQRLGPEGQDLLRRSPILFVVRHQYQSDHHNTATLFQNGEINAGKFQPGSSLRIIDFGLGGRVTTLLDAPQGVIRDPDVSFNGRRVLFSMRKNAADDYHIYEIRADGSGLRQVTSGSGVSDIDPIYLPSGRILFGSTREPKYCMCNRHIMCNLFTMASDGSDIEQIGHSTLFEGHPSLLPDGRVLYDRWEYVDRNFGDAQGAWVCRPDGTNHAIFWGNNTNSPGAVLDNRAVPGTGLFICTFSSCHDRPWGALALVDRSRGIDGSAPVLRTWPDSAIELIGKGNYDTFKKVKIKYEDPYPLSDRAFVCARMTGQGDETGIYWIDLSGREVLLHAESPGCFDPMPLAPRSRPPQIPTRVTRQQSVGYFYVADVYRGIGMEAVDPGEVKYLRVVESPEKRYWTQTAWNGGTGTQAPAMAWDDFSNKRILGTVPVEEDGSVYFEVPANRFVYFQLLDAQKMMVHSMRSGTIVRPGETIGCVGCHEARHNTLAVDRHFTAMQKAARKLRPWYGPERNFNFLTEVQPVFDQACAGCHNYGTAAGERLNLAGDLGPVFNVSYSELRRKKFVRVPGAGPFQLMAPKSWGSHTSPLVDVLLHGHENREIDGKVQFDREAFERIVTWIDINAPYYPEYASSFRENEYGRSPLSKKQQKRLNQLAGSTDANFTRPELSPCLSKIPDRRSSAYGEALEIIESGRRALKQRPRADMPGFRLSSDIEIAQQAKYERLTGKVSPEVRPKSESPADVSQH